jgi:cyd operon protein YbgT
MWYFSWILGTGLALSFAVLNAIWYEIIERQPEKAEDTAVPPPDEHSAGERA